MSQGALCPNLSQKVQKEGSQMANRNFAPRDAIRWFKCKLKPPKKVPLIVKIVVQLITAQKMYDQTSGETCS